MLLRLAQLAVGLALASVGCLFVLAVLYFAYGSLEEFPTAEDTGKVRTVAAVAAVLLLGIAVGLGALLRRVTRMARGRAVVSPSPPAA